MSSRDSRNPLIILIGPTAVGKTAVSIELAKTIQAEIISADASQLYIGMDIGTAKPSSAERGEIPHHLMDIAYPSQPWSLGMFVKAIEEIVPMIEARGKVPMLVGGTGQYVRALLEGWRIPEQAPRPDLRSALESLAEEIGAVKIYGYLEILDPEAAKEIDHRNVRRTIRALEVIFSTGVRFSSQRAKSASPYRILQLGLTMPREDLYRRIDERIEGMFEAGLVDEVRALLQAYPPDLAPFSAIGYREVIAHLAGEISLDEGIVLIKRRTRQFVRRQTNWFKPDDPNIHWIPAGADAVIQILPIVYAFLDEKNSFQF